MEAFLAQYPEMVNEFVCWLALRREEGRRTDLWGSIQVVSVRSFLLYSREQNEAKEIAFGLTFWVL